LLLDVVNRRLEALADEPAHRMARLILMSELIMREPMRLKSAAIAAQQKCATGPYKEHCSSAQYALRQWLRSIKICSQLF
jgi:hypothetical protein